MVSVYQSKQTLWQKTKNAGKEAWRKGAPKVKAAAKVAGEKAIEGGKWAAKEGYKAYQEGSKKPRKKRKGKKIKSRRTSSAKTSRRRIKRNEY
jgi:hypothetical protein